MPLLSVERAKHLINLGDNKALSELMHTENCVSDRVGKYGEDGALIWAPHFTEEQILDIVLFAFEKKNTGFLNRFFGDRPFAHSRKGLFNKPTLALQLIRPLVENRYIATDNLRVFVESVLIKSLSTLTKNDLTDPSKPLYGKLTEKDITSAMIAISQRPRMAYRAVRGVEEIEISAFIRSSIFSSMDLVEKNLFLDYADITPTMKETLMAIGLDIVRRKQLKDIVTIVEKADSPLGIQELGKKLIEAVVSRDIEIIRGCLRGPVSNEDKEASLYAAALLGKDDVFYLLASEKATLLNTLPKLITKKGGEVDSIVSKIQELIVRCKENGLITEEELLKAAQDFCKTKKFHEEISSLFFNLKFSPENLVTLFNSLHTSLGADPAHMQPRYADMAIMLESHPNLIEQVNITSLRCVYPNFKPGEYTGALIKIGDDYRKFLSAIINNPGIIVDGQFIDSIIAPAINSIPEVAGVDRVKENEQIIASLLDKNPSLMWESAYIDLYFRSYSPYDQIKFAIKYNNIPLLAELIFRNNPPKAAIDELVFHAKNLNALNILQFLCVVGLCKVKLDKGHTYPALETVVQNIRTRFDSETSNQYINLFAKIYLRNLCDNLGEDSFRKLINGKGADKELKQAIFKELGVRDIPVSGIGSIFGGIFNSQDVNFEPAIKAFSQTYKTVKKAPVIDLARRFGVAQAAIALTPAAAPIAGAGIGLLTPTPVATPPAAFVPEKAPVPSAPMAGAGSISVAPSAPAADDVSIKASAPVASVAAPIAVAQVGDILNHTYLRTPSAAPMPPIEDHPYLNNAVQAPASAVPASTPAASTLATPSVVEEDPTPVAPESAPVISEPAPVAAVQNSVSAALSAVESSPVSPEVARQTSLPMDLPLPPTHIPQILTTVTPAAPTQQRVAELA